MAVLDAVHVVARRSKNGIALLRAADGRLLVAHPLADGPSRLVHPRLNKKLTQSAKFTSRGGNLRDPSDRAAHVNGVIRPHRKTVALLSRHCTEFAQREHIPASARNSLAPR